MRNKVGAGKEFAEQAEIMSGVEDIKIENWPHWVGKTVQGTLSMPRFNV